MQDQWNQFTVHDVSSQPYGQPLSTVFADPQSYIYDEYNDPAISSLRCINYRYLRFFYNPLEDRFLLISGWKDPLWTNVKVMRSGLDADDRDSREQVFGANLIDIEQKPIAQLLMDEVSVIFFSIHLGYILMSKGFSSILHFPNCQSCPLVFGRILLLRRLYISYFYFQHRCDCPWNKIGMTHLGLNYSTTTYPDADHASAEIYLSVRVLHSRVEKRVL